MLVSIWSLLSIIVFVIVLISYLAYKFFDDRTARETILNIAIILISLCIIISVPLSTGVIAYYAEAQSSIEIMGVLFSIVFTFVGVFLFAYICLNCNGWETFGGSIYSALERSKQNKSNKKLLSDEEIEQEARIRLKMDRYKSTITATQKELDIQQYVNEKRG